jgi:hypothetical protein
MLAAERPQVSCVIGYAALTDFPALPTQRTSGMLTGAAPSAAPRYAYNLAAAAFGTNRLAELSPALQAGRINWLPGFTKPPSPIVAQR